MDGSEADRPASPDAGPPSATPEDDARSVSDASGGDAEARPDHPDPSGPGPDSPTRAPAPPAEADGAPHPPTPVAAGGADDSETPVTDTVTPAGDPTGASAVEDRPIAGASAPSTPAGDAPDDDARAEPGAAEAEPAGDGQPVFELPSPKADRGGVATDSAPTGEKEERTVVLGGAGRLVPPLPGPVTAGTPTTLAPTATGVGTGTGPRPRITPPGGVQRIDIDGGETAPRHLRRVLSDAERRRRRLITLLAGVPVMAVLLLVLGWAIDTAALSGQVMRNVEVADRAVGGLGEASLPEVIDDIAADTADREVRIVSDSGTYETTAGEIGLTIDEEATTEAVLDAGRSDSLLIRPFRWLGSFFGPSHVAPTYEVTEAALNLKLFELQGGDITPPVEPAFRLTEEGFVVDPGQPGEGIDGRAVAEELPEAAAQGTGAIEITANRTDVAPQLSQERAEELAEQANELAADGLNLSVADTDVTVAVDPAGLRTWIDITPTADTPVMVNPDRVTAALPLLFTGLSSQPRDASFELDANGNPRVVPSVDGVVCCSPDSAELIQQALADDQTEVTLEAQVTPADLTTGEAEDLGITQPVGGNNAWRDGAPTTAGAGFTTYYNPGEPRVTNIHRIAELVRGAVILPGEEFSVNDHVGERTSAKGFVEAGAIRDGLHQPEVGGGVSQFATTMFNAAYFAGLDINQYQAHSEYFSRYPPGREATMGYPLPDLVIENNTPHGILVWTSYTDTSVTVTLYSTPYATAEQSAITESMSDQCRVVQTTRTRHYPNGETETDTFRATYRPGEGLNCAGQPISPPPTEAQAPAPSG